ncbi:hypothetical protein [Lentibacillus sp. Marseille-P4043]|uniref:hypothetical protein n=1 Tax=Lentibacillus sp. Marseille-P4043 TaxID=2040293 RepID=UPI000D0BBF5F|nr:hypothetical protein [Lentibacillus sp. Marseille-P4043]
MNERIKELSAYTSEKFGLENYHLKRHHIFYETNNLHKTTYLLSMEWIPNDSEQVAEDYNPPGTAVIDMDIHTKAIKRIVFVHEKSFAVDGGFSMMDEENVIEWIEELTDLQYGRQFQLLSDEDGAYSFQAVVDNIPVYPSGSIEIEFNDESQLTSFSIDGVFPEEDQVKWEPFSLTPEKVNKIASEQCKLIEVPLEAEEKWLSVYGLEELFVSNDGTRTLPFEPILHQGFSTDNEVVLEWDKPIDEPFHRVEIDLSVETSEEQALANQPHPDTFPITASEQEKCKDEALRFMRSVYPDDSGKWALKGLLRENGYIIAELKPTIADNRVLQRKLRLIISNDQYKVLNYIDNNVIFDMFKQFQAAETASITEDDAYQKLRNHVEVMPVYVFDEDEMNYILCGKIDCAYGINAINGEVILLDEM